MKNNSQLADSHVFVYRENIRELFAIILGEVLAGMLIMGRGYGGGVFRRKMYCGYR